MNPMKVWCDTVDAAAKGKTQDTFDSVGTVTIKKGAKEIIGIIVLAASATKTAGENGAPVLQVDSADLGVSRQKFHIGPALSDGIGTNDKEDPVIAEFLPFKAVPLADRSLENSKVEFSVSGSVTTTGGWDIAVGLVFANGPTDPQFLMELLSGACGRAIGGDVAYSRAGIKAASATAFSTGISVTSIAKELIGLCGYLNANAPTTTEACVGVTEFQASQIPDFSPQKWPAMIGYNASLGTPVGTSVAKSARNGLYYPTRFPLPQVSFTISVSMWLATALTNEADGIAGARWR